MDEKNKQNTKEHIDDLAQDCGNSSTGVTTVLPYTIDIILMAQCKTEVTPLLTHWSYCSLARNHWSESEFQQPVRSIPVWRNDKQWEYMYMFIHSVWLTN